jgi:hypothetical protein
MSPPKHRGRVGRRKIFGIIFLSQTRFLLLSHNQLKQKDMGFFSWNTCDTGESIANAYSTRPTFPVHMITPDGRVFTEENYEGYGEFGGKDFHELLAELNGLESDRDAGIDLTFKNNPSGDNTPGVIYPKLVECLEDDVVTQYNNLPNPESCEAQGYFYGGDDEDENEEDEWEWDEEEEEEDDEE